MSTSCNTQTHAVTMKDIAARCGVDESTVSRALKGCTRHNQRTIERIRHIAEEMGYDPELHRSARRLASRRHGGTVLNRLIALLFPPHWYNSAYMTAMYEGIIDVLTPAGFGVLMAHSEGALQPNASLPPSFSGGEVDGMIVLQPPDHFEAILPQLRQSPAFGERPLVTLVHEVPGCSSVLLDYLNGACAALRHLYTLGHRRILYYCHQPVIPTPHVLGYRLACEQLGVNADDLLVPFVVDQMIADIAFVPGTRHRLSDAGQLRYPVDHPLLETLRQHPDITAIMALNDGVAIVTYHILAQHGIRVPDAISLTGFDDVDQLVNGDGENMLTTVQLPLHEAGRRAAEYLVEMVTHGRNDLVHITLPAHFAVRQSTAPPLASVTR